MRTLSKKACRTPSHGGPRCRSCAPFVALLMLAHGAASAADIPMKRQGKTFYVSKLGDDSDGSSWVKAFRSIQKALSVIPDDKGGHRVIVRPDTYMEANLHVAHKGAKNAYNVLLADFDGSLGSGRTGYAVIDSGDPAKGFKSYDWWGTIKSYSKGWSEAHTDETFSATCWDRWVLRHLYATGGDGGLFFDGTNQVIPFTVVVEDCVSIGRAFGGGVGSVLSRPDEPITYRRCHLWCLDWWGDAAGAYFRVENKEMPEHHDVIVEDCTLVGPDNALKNGNPGFATFTRIQVKGSRLISLNFSQPRGTPSTGVIHSTMEGRFMHVDLVDTTVMGYKVFGSGKAQKDGKDHGPIGYTTQGSVRAYVQFQQPIPKGFTKVPYWPTETFYRLMPPAPPMRTAPVLHDDDLLMRDMCEVAPVVWKDRLALMHCHRPGGKGDIEEYYLTLTDVESGKQLARFAQGYGLACAIVHNDTFYAFASRWQNDTWNDVTMFKSTDLETWDKKLVIEQENEHLFNSSVCAGPDGFVMAYETSDGTYPAFSVKFATSKDLETWTKLPHVFGTNRYTACPCIRHAGDHYYMMYLERDPPRHYYFETFIVRSKDLKTWELSPSNPVVAPDDDEDGTNASDPAIVEVHGTTYLYYCVGDQLTWAHIKRAVYDGSMQSLFESFYRGGPYPISR